jgi:hypothetical protein
MALLFESKQPMSLEQELDQEDLARLKAAEDDPNKTVIRATSESQKLGAATVACLTLNRTIGKTATSERLMLRLITNGRAGSGIFVAPAIILKGTGSTGISLILWPLGALVATSGLLVWLELGLSIPKFEGRSVPRSGGEKNYVSISGCLLQSSQS